MTTPIKLVPIYIPHAQKIELLERAVEVAFHLLSDVDFDTIVVTGVSGLSVGAPLALRMKKRLTVVRKPSDFSHGYLVEGFPGKICVMVDDFIATGKTLNRVREAVDIHYLLLYSRPLPRGSYKFHGVSAKVKHGLYKLLDTPRTP